MEKEVVKVKKVRAKLSRMEFRAVEFVCEMSTFICAPPPGGARSL